MLIFYLSRKCVFDYHYISTLPDGRRGLVETHRILDVMFCIRFLLENETYDSDLMIDNHEIT
jgi:hypothetical protein